MRAFKSVAIATLLVALPVAQAWELSSSDAQFLTNAYQSNMAEFKLGKLAEKRGGTKFIRQFGTMMAKNHKTSMEEAAQLAKAEKLELPKGVNSNQQALYNRLSKLRGSSFDREYKAAMFKSHRASYDAFVKARKDASNSNVKNFAERYTPVIQGHLEALQSGKIMGE
jgi:putative membrane protein